MSSPSIELRFTLREHSHGDKPSFKILENKVLWHILPETIYLAMKCEYISLIGESTIAILCHKPHTALLTISPTGTIFIVGMLCLMISPWARPKFSTNWGD